jgi:2-C-methyl-D-erythritol 4-phosphate cytidylyltransferase
MSVGTNIKKRRYELRMSQQELADALGYKTRSTIAKIESGENDVSQKKLAKFAKALDTTVEALITGNAAFAYIPTAAESLGLHQNDSSGHPRTVAIILAGGKSSRNQQNIPNQFINILGKPVIVHCLEAYQAHPSVDDIYIVCLKGWEQIVAAYAEQFHITKLRGLVPAGQSGILSVLNGLSYIEGNYKPDDIVIFQESTRPMVNEDTISKLLQSVYEHGFANICQPMRDILQFTLSDGHPTYVDRNSVVEIQSPEAYRLGIIRSVFNEAEEQRHQLTESCCAMLMYNLGFDIKFIEGSTTNYKIIRQEDIAIVTTMLQGNR